MNVVQRERSLKPRERKRNELVHKNISKGIRNTMSLLTHKPRTTANNYRSLHKAPRYEFNSLKSSMGPPSSMPPSFKRKVVSNTSSTLPESNTSGLRRPRILANDSEVTGMSTPKNRPAALRYIGSSSRGGHSGTRSLKSTSFSIIDATVILAISEGRGMARGEIGMAAVDLRHPHLVLCQFSDTLLYSHTLTKINFFNPVEIIVPHTFCEGIQPNQLYQLIKDQFPLVTLTAVPRRHFNDATGRQNIQTLCAPQYSAVCLQVIHKFYALTAAAAVLKYVEYIQCVVFARESLKIEYHSSEHTMIIDVGTATQLELVQPLVPSAGYTCCLLGVLGPTYTVGGVRALRAMILQPSCKRELIEARLDAVQELMDNESGLAVKVQDVLRRLTDIDKILFLCVETPNHNVDKYGEAQLNQTLMLKTTMELVPQLLEALRTVENGKLRKIKSDFENPNYNEIAIRIRNIIQEDAHSERGALGSMQRCFAVKPNINGLLDVARKTYTEQIDDMHKIVEQLAQTYDLPLRLNQNAMKGFHIILPVAPKVRKYFNVEDIPSLFIQVIFNGASVTMSTEELVVLDHQAKESLSDIQKLSNIIIEGLLRELRPFMSSLYTLCEDVAELDILVALAQASSAGSYIRPDFNDYLDVRNSVHPLLDYNSQIMPVPNDIFASPEHNFTIITGPNMGGKSIYIKQIAIVQIMAQVGCFVPATNAVLRLCDRIFSRIGFNDSVELNASTYVVEMKEIQHILKGLTSSSLVIVDELCRGTCVEEGTSIAWAICEELLASEAFTFFTTHFKQLTRLQELYHNVINRHTAVEEQEVQCDGVTEKRLVYRHKVEAGVTNVENYGLALAAGTNLPKDTIEFAKELAELISENYQPLDISLQTQNSDRIIYNLNADIQNLLRNNNNRRDKIDQIINQFKTENPHIIEKVKIYKKNNKTNVSDNTLTISSIPKPTHDNHKSYSSAIDISALQKYDEKKSTSNLIIGNTKLYTSVKSSTELLNTFLHPINDVIINRDAPQRSDKTARNVNTNSDIDINESHTQSNLIDNNTNERASISINNESDNADDGNDDNNNNISDSGNDNDDSDKIQKQDCGPSDTFYNYMSMKFDLNSVTGVKNKCYFNEENHKLHSPTDVLKGDDNVCIFNDIREKHHNSFITENNSKEVNETYQDDNNLNESTSSETDLLYKLNNDKPYYTSKQDIHDDDNNSFSTSDSDITDALTQVIENTATNTTNDINISCDEELMIETAKQINDELMHDLIFESIVLTPPMGFRD